MPDTSTPGNILHTKFTVSVGSNTFSGIFRRHLAPLTVGALVRALPFEGDIARLGEYIIHVKLPIAVGIERAHTEFNTGDVAFLPSFGNLCFFTAASTTSRPMSPVGKIIENISALSTVKSGDKIRVYLKNAVMQGKMYSWRI